MSYELGVVGAGNMAEAIVRGAIAAGRLSPASVIAADVSEARRAVFTSGLADAVVDSPAEVAARRPHLLLLSVKPQQVGEVLGAIAPKLSPQTLVVSIAAGISSARIEKHLGAAYPWRVIRSMPNTPMLVRSGVVALSRGTNATEADVAAARGLFEPAARVIEVPEKLMDAVTAVSGSGPAYAFFLAEQMISAGEDLGLSPADARLLTAQTLLGAAQMLLQGSESPAELRRRVTSPGGTTQAAIRVLEERLAGKAMIDAVKAAAERSRELGS